MKIRRGERFAMRIAKGEKQALSRVARELDLTLSQLVRRGIKVVLAEHASEEKVKA